jgi:hypothetical protein
MTEQTKPKSTYRRYIRPALIVILYYLLRLVRPVYKVWIRALNRVESSIKSVKMSVKVPKSKPVVVKQAKISRPKIPFKVVLRQLLEPIYIVLLFCGIYLYIKNDRFWQTVWTKWAIWNHSADVWYAQSNIRLKQRFYHGLTLMKLSVKEFYRYLVSKVYSIEQSILHAIYALIQDVHAPNAMRGLFKNIEDYRIRQKTRSLSFKRGVRIFGVWWVVLILTIQLSVAGVITVLNNQPNNKNFIEPSILDFDGYRYTVSVLDNNYVYNGTFLNVSTNAIPLYTNATMCNYTINVYEVKTGGKVNATVFVNNPGEKISTIFVGCGGGKKQYKVSVQPEETTSMASVGIVINGGIQPPSILAVTRYWVGGNGSWSDTAHWSASTGGAGGSSKPTTGDTVIVDTGSDTTSWNFIITLDESTASLLTLTINNNQCNATLYCGASGFTYTTTSATTLTQGCFIAGNAILSIGIGVTTAYTLAIGASGKFYGGTGAHTIGAIDVTALGVCTLTSGRTIINGAVSSGGYCIRNVATSIWNHGGGVIRFAHTTVNYATYIVATKPFNKVIIDSTTILYNMLYTDSWVIKNNTGSWTTNGYGTILGGMLTVNLGTVTIATTPITLNGGLTINGGTFTYTTSGRIDCNGNFNMTGGTYNHATAYTCTFSGKYFNVTGGTFTNVGYTEFDNTIITYTYSGVVAVGGAHNAWQNVTTTVNPPTQVSMNGACTEYTNAQYSPMIASDNSRNTIALGVLGTYSINKYEINNITSLPIANITIVWEGQYSVSSTVQMYVYNFTSTLWETIGASATIFSTDVVLTNYITAQNKNHYVSGGTLRYLVFANTRTITYVDYTAIIVSFYNDIFIKTIQPNRFNGVDIYGAGTNVTQNSIIVIVGYRCLSPYTRWIENGYACYWGRWIQSGLAISGWRTLDIGAKGFWTTGSGYGLKDGSSFENRMTIPTNITNIYVFKTFNLTICLENISGAIVLGSNYIAGMSLTAMGGFWTVNSTNQFTRLCPYRLSVGGTFGFKEYYKYLYSPSMIFNVDWGQNLAKSATGNANHNFQCFGKVYGWNCTFKEFVAYCGILLSGDSVWEQCTFYGSNNGSNYCIGNAFTPCTYTLIDPTFSTTNPAIFWDYADFRVDMNMVGTITRIGNVNMNIYMETPLASQFYITWYKKAYLKVQNSTTYLSNIEYLARESTYAGIDESTSSGKTNGGGTCNNKFPDLYSSGIWCLQKRTYYMRTYGTGSGSISLTAPIWVQNYGNYTFSVKDPNNIYQPTSITRNFITNDADYGTVSSPITITLTKYPTHVKQATLTTDKVNYTQSTPITYFGNYSVDRASTNVLFHLKHDIGSGFTHKWANKTMTANTTYSLDSIFGANDTFMISSPNGSRTSELIISSGNPSIYPEWGNQTYYVQFYVGATAWVNTTTWDNQTFITKTWVNYSREWTNDTQSIKNPTNITVRYWTNYTLIANTTIYQEWVGHTSNWSWYQSYTYLNSTHDEWFVSTFNNSFWTNYTERWTNETGNITNAVNVTIYHWQNYTLVTNLTVYHSYTNNTNMTGNYTWVENHTYNNVTWNDVIMGK